MVVYWKPIKLMQFFRFPFLTLLLLVNGQVSAGCEQLSVDTERGTVHDNDSGLTWLRCLSGQVGRGCLGEADRLSWADSLNRSRNTDLGGISHWRLPVVSEIQALFAIGRRCLESVFPGIGRTLIWSASAKIEHATNAWSFDFTRGEPEIRARDSRLQVLLVATPL